MATVVDNNGQGGQWLNGDGSHIARDQHGHVFVVWAEHDGSVNRTFIYSDVDGVKHLLYGSTTESLAALATTEAVRNPNIVRIGTKLLVAGLRVGPVGIVSTVCIDPDAYATASNWKQTDETTQGSTTVSTATNRGMVAIAKDSLDNVYVAACTDFPVASTFKPRVWKRTASTKTWSAGSNADTVDTNRIDIIVDSSTENLHLVTATSADFSRVSYYKSTNPRDETAWGAGLVVADDTAATTNMCIQEEQDGKFVVTAKGGGSAGFWNYFNGTTWTQGTGVGSGSQMGFTGILDVLEGVEAKLVRDGAKNVYIVHGSGVVAQDAYLALKFAATTWTSHATFVVGMNDTRDDPRGEKYPPTDATTAYALYIDEQGGSPDELVLDTFAVSAAAAPQPPYVRLRGTRLESTKLESTKLESTRLEAT